VTGPGATTTRPIFLSFLHAGLEARKRCYQECIVRRAYLRRPGWNSDWTKEQWDRLNQATVRFASTCQARGYKMPLKEDRDLVHVCEQIERYDRAIEGGLAPDIAARMYGNLGVWPVGEDEDKYEALARLEIARRHPERRRQVFNWDPRSKNPKQQGRDGYWSNIIQHSLDHLHLLWDTADFHANDFLRLLYLYGETPEHLRVHASAWRPRDQIQRDPDFSAAAEEQMLEALLEFKYWLDEDPKAENCGGLIEARKKHDGNKKADDEYKYEMAFWSENHQILFPAAEYLTGQWLPNGIFMPGRAFREGGRDDPSRGDYTGRQRMERARPRILNYLNDRLRFGFSEWNGPGYYKEHLQALFNLAEFCLDKEIRTRTHMVIDLMLFDVARFTHQGNFGTTAGRAYFYHKNCGWDQGVCDLIEMLFGTHDGIFRGVDTAPGMFASGRVYRVPDVLLAIGQDKDAAFIDRSRVSLNFDEAPEYGIGFTREEDIMRWWSRGAWFAKQVIGRSRDFAKEYGLMHSDPFGKVLPRTGALDDTKLYLYASLGMLLMPPLGASLLGLLAAVDEEDMADFASVITEGSALTRANLYTYRNSHASLSSVQNFRAGQYNFQTHVCQATLSMGATVWTTHPSGGANLNNLVGSLSGGLLGAALGSFANLLVGGILPLAPLAAGVAGAIAGAAAGDIPILPVDGNGPNWWTGSVTLPRIIQQGNAAIIAYKPNEFQILLFGHRTHAWFPKPAFDENADADDWIEGGNPSQPGTPPTSIPQVDTTYRGPLIPSLTLIPSVNSNIDTGAWVFGRVGDGYVALYSAQKPVWTTEGDWADREIMAEGKRNIFILQVGSKEEFGSYLNFKRRVLGARIHVNGLHWAPADFQCSYDMPGGKRLELHYDDNQVRYGGLRFSDDDFPRFRNPYAQVAWGQNCYVIQHAGVSLAHDIRTGARRLGGRVRDLSHDVGLKVLAQNMGLFHLVPPYRGKERDRALERLIEILRDEQYDVVGLSEMWHYADRHRILGALGGLYPYHLEGPNEFDLEALDGGLLLLSRHKIVEWHGTVYRQCAGEDCGSNKGALHARIRILGQPCDYDLFLSHAQNLTPLIGSEAAARRALKGQLRHLGAFVRACHDPRNPALLIGDLNVDQLHDKEFEEGHDRQHLYDYLRHALGHPIDLNPDVATSEAESSRVSSFNTGNADRVPNDPQRFGPDAQRLDYLLAWPGALFEPTFGKGEVMVYQSNPGRDLSDHYGIRVTLETVKQKLPEGEATARGVSVALTRFSCLDSTSGLGSDEVQFTLRCITGRNEERTVTTPVYEDVDSGDQRSLDGLGVVLGEPGEYIWISVSGKEIDALSGNDNLGVAVMRLDRYELSLLRGRRLFCGLPRLTGDGGEYVVEVEIQVT
jgi:hypothetical protein